MFLSLLSLISWKTSLSSLKQAPKMHSQNVLVLFCFCQGTVRGVHDPLCKLCLELGQPRPLRERRPVAVHALGGAAEGDGSGAVVWRFQGGPGSHEVAETLLQVSGECKAHREVIKGVTMSRYCANVWFVVGFRTMSVCFMIISWKSVLGTLNNNKYYIKIVTALINTFLQMSFIVVVMRLLPAASWWLPAERANIRSYTSIMLAWTSWLRSSNSGSAAGKLNLKTRSGYNYKIWFGISF